MEPKRSTITFRLPHHVLKWIQDQSRRRHVSVSDFLRELLEREMGTTAEGPSEDEQHADAIRKIMELRQQGMSFEKIALALNKAGLPTKRSGEWHASTVSYILKNAGMK